MATNFTGFGLDAPAGQAGGGNGVSLISQLSPGLVTSGTYVFFFTPPVVTTITGFGIAAHSNGSLYPSVFDFINDGSLVSYETLASGSLTVAGTFNPAVTVLSDTIFSCNMDGTLATVGVTLGVIV